MSQLTTSFFLLLLLSIATTSSAAATAPRRCSTRDAAALLQIKTSLAHPPSLSSWNSSVDCCSWAYVGCDAKTNSVTFLRIAFDSNIVGPIPPSISKLTQLTTLQIFSNPHLSGPIPNSLCTLPNLAKLDLSLNALTGPIPPCFGKHLNFIDLSMNQLTGPIPNNFMLGATKAEMSTPWLNLQQNQLSGPIPKSLGDVPLNGLELSNNHFTGDVSFLLGNNIRGSLQYLELSGNDLAFDMSNVAFPEGMQRLMLDGNRIYGSIWGGMSRLVKLNFFNVSNNDLCGPIPASSVMQKFDASCFAHNKCLCGVPLKPCSKKFNV